MEKTLIGYMILSDATTYTNLFECAAWYEKIQVPAGKYPVFATVKNGEVDDIWYSLPGTITSDYFQPLFCGNRIGSQYDIFKNTGKATVHRGSFRAYSLAKNILEGQASFELSPEFEAREIHFQWDGKPEKTWGLFSKEAI